MTAQGLWVRPTLTLLGRGWAAAGGRWRNGTEGQVILTTQTGAWTPPPSTSISGEPAVRGGLS